MMISVDAIVVHESVVQLFLTPWTVARQAPLSMGFSRQEFWSGLLCPSPGDLPDPGIEPTSPMSPALTVGFFTTGATWKASGSYFSWVGIKFYQVLFLNFMLRTMWIFCFSLLIWWIMLIIFQRLEQPSLTGINPIGHGALFFLYVDKLDLVIFY